MSYFNANRSLENLPKLSKPTFIDGSENNRSNLDYLHLDSSLARRKHLNSSVLGGMYGSEQHRPSTTTTSPNEPKKIYFDVSCEGHLVLQNYLMLVS